MSNRAGIIAGVFSLMLCPTDAAAPEPSIAAQAGMIVATAKKYHYLPRPVDNAFSERVYTSFLHMLDPFGTYFTVESVMKLDKYKFDLDDQIAQQKTDFLDTAAALYEKRLRAADSLLLL